MSNQFFSKVPDVVDGYILDPAKGWFSVVLPAARVNFCANPSFESNATGYTATASVIARVTTKQARGVYSLEITPGGGATVEGVYYTYASRTTVVDNISASADFWGAVGDTYQVYMTNAAGATIESNIAEFAGKNKWVRVSVVANLAAGAHTGRLYFVKKASASVKKFYVDGVQLEEGTPASTYIDGDQEGFLSGQTAYYWEGVVHASNSGRIGMTRAGGIEYPLKDLGFEVMGISGLGMPTMNTIHTPISTGGGLYQRSTPQVRQFTLAGSIMGSTYTDLFQKRANLLSALDPTFSPSQEILLRFHKVDSCTGAETKTIDIPCTYVSGLEGNITNPNQERVGIVFAQGKIAISDALSDGGGIFFPSYYSLFNNIMSLGSDLVTTDAMSGGANSVVQAIEYCSYDNCYYIGGNFTSIGGVAINYFARYNPATRVFSAPSGGVGPNAKVRCIYYHPENNAIYIGGDFTTVDVGIAVDYVAKLNLSDNLFSAIGGSVLNSGVRCFCRGTVASDKGSVERGSTLRESNGYIYIGGDFTYDFFGSTAFGLGKIDTAVGGNKSFGLPGVSTLASAAGNFVADMIELDSTRNCSGANPLLVYRPIIVTGKFTQLRVLNIAAAVCTFTCPSGITLINSVGFAEDTANPCPGTMVDGAFKMMSDAFGTGLAGGSGYVLWGNGTGNYFVGGDFTSINGDVTRGAISALWGVTKTSNGVSGSLSANSPAGGAFSVSAGFPSTGFFIGGNFTTIGTLSLGKLAQISGNTWQKTFDFFSSTSLIYTLCLSPATEDYPAVVGGTPMQKLYIGFNNPEPKLSLLTTTINSGNKDILLEFRSSGYIESLVVNDLALNLNYTIVVGERVFVSYTKKTRTIRAWSSLGHNISALAGSGIISDTQTIKVKFGNGFIESGDNNNQLSKYSLNGITTTNIDFLNEKLYLDLVANGAAGGYVVNFYKDSGRAIGNLVAHTPRYTAADIGAYIAVSQDNASGISGWIKIDAVTAIDGDIDIKVPFLRYTLSESFGSLDEAIV